MSVTGRFLTPAGIHQLFAIFGLVRQIDEGEAKAGKIAEAEVGDIPLWVGRKNPRVLVEAVACFAKDLINFGAFHD